MTKKIFAILLMTLLVSGNILPAFFTFAYWYQLDNNEECVEGEAYSFLNKMKNNGDKYLLALLKRTCESNESKNTKAPLLNLLTVVQIYERENKLTTNREELVCNKIPDHYFNLYSYLFLVDIFHPPLFAA